MATAKIREEPNKSVDPYSVKRRLLLASRYIPERVTPNVGNVKIIIEHRVSLKYHFDYEN